jgi:hypothetical protein
MNNNFIKLTEINTEEVVLINITLIQSIHQRKTGSFIVMSFKSNVTYHVVETPKEIMKLMRNKIYVD